METLKRCPICDSRKINRLSNSGGGRGSRATYFCLDCSVEVIDRPKSATLIVAVLSSEGAIVKSSTVERDPRYYEIA